MFGVETEAAKTSPADRLFLCVVYHAKSGVSTENDLFRGENGVKPRWNLLEIFRNRFFSAETAPELLETAWKNWLRPLATSQPYRNSSHCLRHCGVRECLVLTIGS